MARVVGEVVIALTLACGFSAVIFYIADAKVRRAVNRFFREV